MRRTKIVATIGPACENDDTLIKMVEVGVDVFRFNMKHGEVAWHSKMMVKLEKVCKEKGVRAATLIDLQGPEVRIDGLPKSPMLVNQGDRFWFTGSKDGGFGVVLDHQAVIPLVKAGNIIYADDGFLEFRVTEAKREAFEVEVIEGGELKNRKTVNFPGIKMDFPCLVDKDLELLSLTARHTVDYVALSFVRSPEDVMTLQREIEKLKVDSAIIAKIEHPEAVAQFEEILNIADGIMVARGDLGIEYPLEEVPALQKMMVQRAIEVGKPVIVATQMLESMHTKSRPTRAEVSDVANAVYDRADAVMLSGETAIGKYPIKAVTMMSSICSKTEPAIPTYHPEAMQATGSQGEAMVAAAYQLSLTYADKAKKVKAFVVMTETGRTARLLAKLRPTLPIYALSNQVRTLDKLKLNWGIESVYFAYEKNRETNPREVLTMMQQRGILMSGDKVIVIYGERWGEAGQTSVVRIQEVV